MHYGLEEVPGLEPWGASFRGPAPTRDGFVAFLGAAQTFGRLCARPYPSLISAQLGVEVLNLGHGGAGPELFLRPDFLSVVRRASIVVVQVMSARSQSTAHFRSENGLMAGQRVSDGKTMVAEELFEDLFRDSPHDVPEGVAEFQRCYEISMEALIKALHPRPVILFWFSVRAPGTVKTDGSAQDVLGTFPQLVSWDMIERLQQPAAEYVECVTSDGLPRRIVDAGGAPSSFVLDYRLSHPKPCEVQYDSYYPSPEMHVAAANRLAPTIQSFLRNGACT